MVKRWFQDFGPLRLVLIAVVTMLVALGPFSGGNVRFDGLLLITTLVAPVAYAIFIFVLPLDMMMSLVFMSGASAAKRAAMKRVIVTEGVLFLAMILAWLPFVLRLLRIG